LRAGLAEGASVVVAADIRYGLPGSADESEGSDAAAAFVIGDDPVAELLASVSESSELLDRWREPGDVRTRNWEERFGAEEYVPLATRVIDDVLARCELKREDIDHVVVSGPHARAVKTIRGSFASEQLAGAGRILLGFGGTADLGLQLAAALETAVPGQVVLALSVADGADAFVFRVTDKILARVRSTSLAEAVSRGLDVSYADYLTWRGLLPREPARRPEVKAPAPPASRRTYGWKFGFLAAQCLECGYRNMPPRRVCLSCSATDRTEPVSMLRVPARVVTFSDDMLSESVQLPAKVVAIDFEGGGRFEFEMTDAVGLDLAVGDRVAPTFRVASVASNQIRNYVWKVRPYEGEGA
jgi:hydroxymethylglutaryl-CoA synthase